MTALTAFMVLTASAVIQIIYLIRKTEKPDPVSHYLLLAGSILLFFVTIYRSILIRFAAVTNTFESLVFFSGTVSLIMFLYRIQKKRKVLPFVVFGGTFIAIILLAVASSPIAPDDIRPPIPALQSMWLVLHVTFAFIGEAFFALSFVTAVYALAVKDNKKRISAERLTYTSVAIGYPIYTAGALIFGAIWAEAAWGSYWSWDPKETWALITWLVYTAFLHARLVSSLRGRTSSVLAVIGFVFTLFTFFGVNFLLPGLHSYA